jgi:hypothetical protein
MADGSLKMMSQVRIGDLVSAGPLGSAKVLGLHRNIAHGRPGWMLNGLLTIGDHLFLTEDGAWGVVERELYGRLRDAQYLWLHPDNELVHEKKVAVACGRIPTHRLRTLKKGTWLYGGMKADLAEPMTLPYDYPLFGLWTDKGAYMMENGLVADGFPQETSEYALKVSLIDIIKNRAKHVLKLDRALEQELV